MNQLSTITNVKEELDDSKSTDRLEFPFEIPINSIKQESDHLVYSEIYIKTEARDDESEFQITAENSSEKCTNDDVTVVPNVVIIKKERVDMLDEFGRDPLDDSSEIKDERNSAIELEDESSCNKTEGKEETVLVKKKYVRTKVKKYICDVCNKKFVQKYDLTIHYRSHTGEKPFKCEICEKSFIQKGPLNRHMLCHTGGQSHICNICQRVFKEKSNLTKHMVTHNDDRPYSCDQCEKTYKYKKQLQIHKYKHFGSLPFACDFCDKTFNYFADLRRHKRTHTGEKPYACGVCNKSFVVVSSLKRHKNKKQH